MTTFKEQYPHQPLDKNLWYRYNRGNFRQQEPLKRGGLDLNSLVLQRTGKFYSESPSQNYDNVQIIGGEDKNLFFRRPSKRLQPILQKRLFKDLEPASRVIGSLDLTKKQRQASMVISGIQNISDVISNFLKTPKLHADGSPILNPITNQPEFETRSLHEVMAVSHQALSSALKQNNIVPSENIKLIIPTFTTQNVMNILNKFQVIIERNPGITPQHKREQFMAAILQERLKDVSNVHIPEVEQAIANEIVDEKEINVPIDWDEKEASDLFPTRGFKPAQWKASQRDKMSLAAFVYAKQKRDNISLRSSGNFPIQPRMMGVMFDKGHILDLDRLKFRKPRDTVLFHLNDPHPSRIIIAPPPP